MHPADLESLVDRGLRKLPAPRAPGTLLPRVLAAVDAWARRPWYTRDWFSWPLGWQAASVGVLVLMLYAVARLPDALAVTAGAKQAIAATSAAGVVWRALIEPFLVYASAVVVLMCVASAALGAALNYVVLERAEQR